MADKIISFRPDTSTNWGNNNTVLSAGEGGYETDTGLIKIGDGNDTPWNDLDYYVGSESVGTSGQVLTSNGAGSAPSMADPTMPKQYTEADGDFTITVANATLASVVSFVLVPYQTTDGAWRLIGNGTITLDGTADDFHIKLSGITFSGDHQPIVVLTADYEDIAIAFCASGDDYLNMRSNNARAVWRVSFDVELDSKPSWAD